MRHLHALIITISIFGSASIAQQSSYAPARTQEDARSLALEYESADARPERETASLQIPTADPEYRQDRRCMTVCSRWGEDCVIVNPGTDLVARKCVRMCKSFAEECL